MLFGHRQCLKSYSSIIKRRFSFGVEQLREQYQRMGHEFAEINPLDSTSKIGQKFLPNVLIGRMDPVTIGFKRVDNVDELKSLFNQIYCSSCGFEFSHLSSEEEQKFLTEKIESVMTMKLVNSAQKDMAKLLLETEIFDLFMQKRFSQVKRYGLEGLETASVVLDIILKTAIGIDHVVVTMPHRGRLNLMTLLMNYPREAIFHKLLGFSELPNNLNNSADVLSHLSLQKQIEIAGNPNGTITLLPNPSHLEAGNSVGLGVVYAYQHHLKTNQQCLSVQFHGDAAFSGQGIVTECLQLSGLKGFAVKGTIHVICNNQIGFTTTPKYGRTSRYASDPAKTIDAPIFHVNANDPEAVAKITSVAVEYQKSYQKDVVIDLIGWRKMGHNELDEPAFTQPQMYKNIRNRISIPVSFATNVLKQDEISEIELNAYKDLEDAVKRAKDYKPELIGIQKNWGKLENLETCVSKEILKAIGRESVKLPENFTLHSRLQKHHVENRIKQLEDERVDWATAEAMAIGTLINEGYSVRLSGQDVARGTFSQRHLKFHDQVTEEEYEPFNKESNESKLELVSSNLSEFGVLGFEYGVSIVSGNGVLPIWEAQFGDFFNGAQIIFDAFLSSGEEKWGLSSNLTVLLPHGFDGAGPEHSSSRIERFLQGCDDKGNWRVVNPTTPANYFHLLRSQIKCNSKKPLIVISPKTLLKSPMAISPLSDFNDTFKPIIIDQISSRKQRLLLMSGKFYYEIKKELPDTFDTIVRIEQLNPLPEELKTIKMEDYNEIIWCQEEPKNQGAYSFIASKLQEKILKGKKKEIKYVGRPASAAPATGIPSKHKEEIQEILNQLKSKSTENILIQMSK